MRPGGLLPPEGTARSCAYDVCPRPEAYQPAPATGDQPLVYGQNWFLSRFRRAELPETRSMSRNPPVKMDASAAWKAWTTNGSPEAAAQFLERVGSWTDGTAAQLTRGAAGRFRRPPTRDEIAARLRQELGLLAGGEPVTYLAALDVARQNVIDDLRTRPPG